MNKLMVFGFAALSAAVSFGSDWLYSGSSLTEQVAEGKAWVLVVSAKGTEISVSSVTTRGDNMELDFWGSIQDGNGNDYTIVSLDGFSGQPITKLVFPTGIRKTCQQSFLNCTSLKTVTPLIPDTITEFGQRTFAGCTALEGDVVFPAHQVTSTYSWTNGTWGWFNGSKITSADLSAATMTEIVKGSFQSCKQLKWVKLPKGLTSIGEDAFTGSDALETVEPLFPDTVTSFGVCPFSGCSSLKGDVKLTNTAATVTFTHHNNNGYGVFQSCSKITSFEMTAKISHNRSGEGHVDQNMFAGCSSLGYVILPANVKGLAYSGVFSSCSSLTNITFLGWQAPTSFSKNSFDGVTDNKTRIFFPRLSPTWEAFIPTLTKFEPMSDTLETTYKQKYPNATILPLGRFQMYQRWVWVSDLEDPDANSYYVLGDPVEATTEETPVTPGYGGYHGLANGSSVVCTAPQVAVYDSGEYRCKGYEISYETATPRVWSTPVTNEGTSCTITGSDNKNWRLKWLWGPNGYELNSTPVNAGGTVTCNPANEGLYEPDTEVTITATADTANGYEFVSWVGADAPTGDAAFNPVATVTMAGSREVRAAFASNKWTYESGKISNGNWTLNVAKNGTELSVTSVSSAYAEGAIDFTQPITDADENVYSIVSIDGFQGKGVVSVVLPDGLRTLGKNAFYQCAKLKTVTPLLPSSLTTLGQCAFSGCTSLEGDVVLPANTIASPYSWSNDSYGWFRGTKITSFDGSAATMTEVVHGSFCGCAQLIWVKLPKGVTTISDNAFYNASALTTIDPFFPDTVTHVGRGVLYGNNVFSQPLFLKGKADITTSYNNNLSWDGIISGTKIPYADLSGGITGIQNGGFANASSVGTIILGSKLVTLAEQSLQAAGLTNLVFLGDAPTSISGSTFRDWSSYQIVITLPLDKPGWKAYAADHFREPTDAEKAAYKEKYPNGRKLRAIWQTATHSTAYVCDSSKSGLAVVLR